MTAGRQSHVPPSVAPRVVITHGRGRGSLWDQMLRDYRGPVSGERRALAVVLELSPFLLLPLSLVLFAGDQYSVARLALGAGLMVKGMGWLSLGVWPPLLVLSAGCLFLLGIGMIAGVYGLLAGVFGSPDTRRDDVFALVCLAIAGCFFLLNALVVIWSTVVMVRRTSPDRHLTNGRTD